MKDLRWQRIGFGARTNTLKRKAEVAGMSAAAFMSRPPSGISTTTKRQITLAKTPGHLWREE